MACPPGRDGVQIGRCLDTGDMPYKRLSGHHVRAQGQLRRKISLLCGREIEIQSESQWRLQSGGRQFIDGPGGLNASVTDEYHVISQSVGILQNMRRENNAHPAGFQVFEELNNNAPRHRIEASRWFI